MILSPNRSHFGAGARFAFRAMVLKPGRTLTVCEGRAHAIQHGAETLIATMTGTLMALPRRETAPAQDGVRASA